MLYEYSLSNSEEWDKIVRTFQNFDTYYLSGYVKAFQLHGDGDPLLLYYTSKNDPVRAINVVMRRKVTSAERLKNKKFELEIYDVATPYGYGGWLIEGGDNTYQLFKDYSTWCKKENIVSEFVRFHPMLENQKNCVNEYMVLPLGETVAIDLSDKYGIWENMSSKNRNMIRKAQKNGIRIYQARNPEIFKVFKSIYDSTMDKDNADQYYYFEDSFYKSILTDLPENAQVFYAQMDDGKIIAASILLSCNGYMNYHLSGSVREYSHLAPTNLLLYKAALWGNANGYRTLYLGGGVGSEEDSLFKFKRAFYKGDLHRFYIGKKVFNKELYDSLCTEAGVESHSGNLHEAGFFPEYRQTFHR